MDTYRYIIPNNSRIKIKIYFIISNLLTLTQHNLLISIFFIFDNKSIHVVDVIIFFCPQTYKTTYIINKKKMLVKL